MTQISLKPLRTSQGCNQASNLRGLLECQGSSRWHHIKVSPIVCFWTSRYCVYLCNENACLSISFNRNSDKLWYVSSHLKILKKAPVMRGKLYMYTMTKYQRFELLIFANWKNQRVRRGNEECSSLTERGATFNYGRYMKGVSFFCNVI